GKQLLEEGGIVTTTQNTGEQWDAPNGWAPLQWIAVSGLRQYAQGRLAETIACRWMVSVKRVYGETGKLVEKYDVMSSGRSGGGGEYPLQDGFGWTNGVMRKLMALYRAEAGDSHGEQCPKIAKGVQRFSAAVLARARQGSVPGPARRCIRCALSPSGDCRSERGAWVAPSKPRLPRPISRQEA